MVGSALHLRSQKLPISISDSKNHRLLALGHGPSNLSRAFNCLDYITNSDVFNGLVGAIGHQNRSAPANALHVVGTSLILRPVARLLDRPELQDSVRTRDSPDGVLTVVSRTAAENLGRPFLDADQLHRLAPEDDAVILRGHRQTQQQVRLSTASGASVKQNVRLALKRLLLRSRLRNPYRRVASHQDGIHLPALLRRQRLNRRQQVGRVDGDHAFAFWANDCSMATSAPGFPSNIRAIRTARSESFNSFTAAPSALPACSLSLA